MKTPKDIFIAAAGIAQTFLVVCFKCLFLLVGFFWRNPAHYCPMKTQKDISEAATGAAQIFLAGCFKCAFWLAGFFRRSG